MSTKKDTFVNSYPVRDKEAFSPNEECALSNRLEDIAMGIVNTLSEKNAAYGDTIANPANIFSNLSSEEALKVRIDDKLSRIKNGGIHGQTEDSLRDLVGYLIRLIDVTSK